MMLRLLQALAMAGIGSLTREVIARDINPEQVARIEWMRGRLLAER